MTYEVMLHFAPRTLMLTTPRMPSRNRALIFCLITLCVASAQSKTPRAAKPKPTTLAKTIGTILSDPAVARAHWGISIVTLDGKPVYALNERQYFQPASNAKLFT